MPTTSQACKKAGITDQTYYRWRKQYGGMRLEQQGLTIHVARKLTSIDVLRATS